MCKIQKLTEQSDLFSLIYFVSEVYALLKDGAEDYFKQLFSGMRSGALVLYVDNNYSDFTEWVDETLNKYGLDVIKSGNGKQGMPIPEEKQDLGKYYQKFASDPRLDADVAWRLARKR